MNEAVINAVKTIWDWLPLEDSLSATDIIFVLGSSSPELPLLAAEFYNKGLAPFILVSGGFGRLSGDNKKSEAEIFADILMKRKVPRSNILVENKSTNTGENVAFSKEILEKEGFYPKIGIAITTAILSRRQKATLEKQWKEIKWQVSYPKTKDTDYYSDILNGEFINVAVGEIDRLLKYPKKGFINAQNIPDEIVSAQHTLIGSGYTKYLVN